MSNFLVAGTSPDDYDEERVEPSTYIDRMTVRKKPHGHIWYECPKPCYTLYCQWCEGGLGMCTVCGGAEGTLPTQCPGVEMTQEQMDAIYLTRTLDFKDGKWIELKENNEQSMV